MGKLPGKIAGLKITGDSRNTREVYRGLIRRLNRPDELSGLSRNGHLVRTSLYLNEINFRGVFSLEFLFLFVCWFVCFFFPRELTFVEKKKEKTKFSKIRYRENITVNGM